LDIQAHRKDLGPWISRHTEKALDIQAHRKGLGYPGTYKRPWITRSGTAKDLG
jgi:hypothetical protein